MGVKMDKKEQEGFNDAKRSAEEYAKDKEKTAYLLKEAFEKAKENKGALSKIWDDLMSLFRLLKAWRAGEYTEVPWQTILFAIAAVIYFVNPFDAVPDFIPGVGYLDDITVIGFVMHSLRKNIEKFFNWERKTQ
jgi:uncharacterized membrane protein YkvA (DUF1232 family)